MPDTDARPGMREGDRLLLSLTRGVRGPLSVTAAATVLASAATLALPAVLAATVDDVLAGTDSQAVWLLALVLLTSTCAAVVTSIAGAATTASATASLRLRLTGHVLALDALAARRMPAGELANRLVSNTASAGHVPITLIQAVTGLATSAGGVVLLLVTDWRSGVVFLVGAPIVMLIMRVFVTRLTDVYGRYQQAHGRLATRLIDALSGIRTVRASGTADREIGRVLQPLADLSGAGHDMWQAQARGVWKIVLLLPIMEVLVLAVAGFGVTGGRLEPGQLLAVVGYTAIGLTFIDELGVLVEVAEARSAARRVHEVLEIPAPRAGTGPLAPGPGALSLRGVSVSRDGVHLLDGIDLDVPAAKLTALVGPSGAGKTTLALLAGRLLDPDQGQVRLDGHDVTEVHPDALSSAVAYAFERPVLLGGDLAGAISYGRPATEHELIRSAAESARIGQVIDRLPLGYGTPSSSAPLSGGELQRLGLARALVRQARLTVLDDATSSLDTATEAQVSRALMQDMRDTTRLVIAHRAATAAGADHVVWLERGRIRAQGSHQELWRDPGYRALFAAGGESDDTTTSEETCPVRV